jgi:uncharacterized protein YjbJ (UPF0337 family)
VKSPLNPNDRLIRRIQQSIDICELSIDKRNIIMNKDQVSGTVKDAAGKVQQKIGQAVGSEKQQAKGLGKQVEGKVQKAFGNAKETLKDEATKH